MTNRTITAVYDDEAVAHRAREQLIDSGIEPGDVRIVGQNSTSSRAESTDKGILESLADLLIVDADRPLYVESLRRGAYLLAAHVDDDASETAISLLERTTPVDLDARARQWRDEGWSPEGLGAPASMYGYAPGAGPTTESVAQDLRSHAQALDEQARRPTEDRVRMCIRESDRGSVRVRSYVYALTKR